MAVALDGGISNGDDVVDTGLNGRKAVWTIEGVIAVVVSIPTEVEMEQTVVVVSVSNEGMTA